ncbi:MAG: LysM peptidoglycan-binding domain-containing protein [Lentisphaerae bacterium]|nr:LysM peptidoglycan-binding domain-containing protein [Lentisphaerota bacterium]
MRRQAHGSRITSVGLSAVAMAGAAAIMVSGCARRPQPGLLGTRMVVPAPYVEPAVVPSASMALPSEPAFPALPALPALPAQPLSEGSFQAPIESVIELPADDEVKPAASSGSKSAAASRPEDSGMTYTVKKGDSLWLIGQMYGVSVAELTALNGLNPDKVLKIGQILSLPAGARLRDISEIRRATRSTRSTPAPAARPRSTGTSTRNASTPSRPARSTTKEPIPADGIHVVKSGDNPWTVARRYGVPHADLMRWNELTSASVLQVGQKLRLRGTAAASTSTGTTLPATAPAAAVPAAVTAPVTLPAPTDVLPETAPVTAPALDPAAPLTPPATAPAAAPGAGLDPAAAPAPAAALPTGAVDLPKKLQHSFTDGESLQIIADMYGTTVDAILKENPTIKSDADLKPNVKLMVPYR